jgi:transposase-like protein
MSTTMDEEVKRLTAWRKSALVLEIIQGKSTVSEASRQYGLAPSEIEEWIEHGKAGMENALRAKPENVREQHELEIKALQEAYGEAMLELRARNNAVPVGQGRAMIEGLQQGLKEDGLTVSISKLCQWFNVPRRTVYYRPQKAPSRLKPAFVEPIKAMIEEEASFGYRRGANCWASTRIRFKGSFSVSMRCGPQLP